MAKPSLPPGVERFKIARGAVANMRPVLVAFLALVVGWMGLFFLLIPRLVASAKGFIALGPVGLLVMVLSLIVYMNLPGKLDIGPDGLFVDWRNEKRYVPFADLEDAPPYAETVMGKHMIGVSLVLRSGDPLKVPIGEDQFGADKKVAELSQRIRAALEGFRRRETAEDGSVLARGDRTTVAWLERLRGLGEGANAGHREAPIPADRLWRIALDPTVTAPVRAGAAVALSHGLDDAGKERLRVAAASTVAPRLRIALEAAAAGDEEAVALALEEVESEGAS